MVETLLFFCVFGLIIVACGLCLFAISVPSETDAMWDPSLEPYYSYDWVFLRPYFMFNGKDFIRLTMAGRNFNITKVKLTKNN